MVTDPDDWALPDEDYRFTLGIHPGDPRQFFGCSRNQKQLLAERRFWLSDHPDRYAAILPEADRCLEEVESLMSDWGIPVDRSNDSLFDRLVAMGRQAEPDLVLLQPDGNCKLIVVAGCVCFPSFWRLTDKLGQSMSLVHETVPGLNPTIGSSIERYLSQMKTGGCWFRANWGLAARPDLNEHPDRGRHPWEQPLSLERIWIRREDQAIVSLPKTKGILFGIRVVVRPVADLVNSPEKRRRLLRGLQTMPAEMVGYKGIAPIQDELISLLKSV